MSVLFFWGASGAVWLAGYMTGLNLFKQQNSSRLFRTFFRKIYCCSVPHAHATESGMSLVEFFMIFFQEPTLTAVQAAALLKHSMISGCWLREWQVFYGHMSENSTLAHPPDLTKLFQRQGRQVLPEIRPKTLHIRYHPSIKLDILCLKGLGLCV